MKMTFSDYDLFLSGGGGSFYIFGKNAPTMNVMYQVEAMLYISNHESLSGAQTADGISCNGE